MDTSGTNESRKTPNPEVENGSTITVNAIHGLIITFSTD
jgi:hypothetical protein